MIQDVVENCVLAVGVQNKVFSRNKNQKTKNQKT